MVIVSSGRSCSHNGSYSDNGSSICIVMSSCRSCSDNGSHSDNGRSRCIVVTLIGRSCRARVADIWLGSVAVVRCMGCQCA